ncbi:MAG: S46 family peptidase [Ignavibacteriae bacterium]|nr:S46 family peptidase [Ignavibacteriota bacterium]
MKTKKYSTVLLISFLFLFLTGMFTPVPEEGMFPLSEIHKIDLVKAGLKIDPLEVYNPNGISLIDALVKVGGCSGSFISEEGLILTNHHCAFGAISKASSPENNYLENGFLAKTKLEEIPAKGTTVRITESYEDVSEVILNSVIGIEDLAERAKIIEDKMKELADSTEDKTNSIVGEVSEMFKGKTYVLFKYRIIKDVRLVYAPPRSIGEFGGETDNWVWPRHTGDFTFMRAYVAPDGSAAEFAEKNIPYSPKKYLRINPNGVEENDFVFILGYPGTTFRHLPSYFLEYQQNYNLPYISETYEWMINELEVISKNDVELQLKFASNIKRLGNTMKNFKGKLKGFKRLELVEKKQNEEKELLEFINENNELKNNYGNLFSEYKSNYDKLFSIADKYLWLNMFKRFSTGYKISNKILEYCTEMQKPENERKDNYKSDKIEKSKEQFVELLKDYNSQFEKSFLNKMFTDAEKLQNKIQSLENVNNLNEFVENTLMNSKIFEQNNIDELLLNCPDEFEDSFINLVKNLESEFEQIDEQYESINNRNTKLAAELYEVKKLWKKSNFIPDANSTLRLTYGYVKGYSPSDAVYMSPLTTLSGVIDKSYLGSEYAIPDKLKTLYNDKDFGQFYDEELGDVPVALLYNTDTTGGNSGSPIMNAKGEMIGINFDRAYEATINDFAWDESYSRSIGVDIRYVLFITQKLGGADYLLDEIGI